MTAVILGGGISGLASAYYLVRNSSPFKKIILLEASDRIGGWVQSTRLDNGALFEQGPRSIRPVGKQGLNTLSLITELGLSNELIAVKKDHPAARNRFIYVNKKIHRLPSGGLKTLLVTQPPFSKPMYKVVWKEVRAPKGQDEDESIHSFISRRFGTEIAEYIFNPVMRGIFAGDITKLSAKSCLPFDMYNLEKQFGSVIRGLSKSKPKADTEVYAKNDIERAHREKWSTWSLRNGLSQLTDRLEDAVQDGVEIRKSTPCKKLEFNDNTVKVITESESIEADHVISSLFSQDLAGLFDGQHQELSDYLNEISAVSCIVVNIEYKNYMPEFEGFGHLLPSSEDPSILGVIYDSSTFKPHDTPKYISTRYTLMLGGAWFDHLVNRLGDLKESTVQDFACRVMREQLDIQVEPSEVIVTIQKNCIPQYYVGHSQLINNIDSYVTDNRLPISLVGASYKGVAINDVILNAKIAMKPFDKGLNMTSDSDSTDEIKQEAAG